MPLKPLFTYLSPACSDTRYGTKNCPKSTNSYIISLASIANSGPLRPPGLSGRGRGHDGRELPPQPRPAAHPLARHAPPSSPPCHAHTRALPRPFAHALPWHADACAVSFPLTDARARPSARGAPWRCERAVPRPHALHSGALPRPESLRTGVRCLR